MKNYLSDAIYLLKPTAEFSFTDNDYSTIKWDKLEGDAPTQTEITAAIKVVKANEGKAETDKAAAKASAQAKLAALGLTADEVAAIVGN
jgi:hypothetical protein